MNGSILDDVKKTCGLDPSYEAFDEDIKIFINGVLLTLDQIGVGPAKPIQVEDGGESWDMITDNDKILGFLPAYVGLRVRMSFDPPQSSALSASIDNMIKEYEWRISVAVDEERRHSSEGGMTTFV